MKNSTYDQQEKAWELTAPKYESYRTISVDDVLLSLRSQHRRDPRTDQQNSVNDI